MFQERPSRRININSKVGDSMNINRNPIINANGEYIIYNTDIDYQTMREKKVVKFNGPCCGKCRFRFDGIGDFCDSHYKDPNCYKMKL